MAGKASSSVGVLTVFMDAITDQFHAGLNKAESAIGTFKGKLRGMSHALKAANEAMRNAEAALRVFQAASDLVNAKTYEDINAAWVGIGDAITALPGPLGEAASLIRNMLFTLTGARKEMDGLAEAAAENVEEGAKIDRQHANFVANLRDIEQRTKDRLADEERYLQILVDEGVEAGEKYRREREWGAELRRIVKDQEDAANLRGRFAGMHEMDRKSILIALGDEFQREMAIMHLKKKAWELAQKAAADALKLAKDKADADKLAFARKERLHKLDQAMAAMARLQQKRARVAGRSLAAGANTFTSPMGTISLPALNQTAELARLQLTELQAIEALMVTLRSEIAALSVAP